MRVEGRDESKSPERSRKSETETPRTEEEDETFQKGKPKSQDAPWPKPRVWLKGSPTHDLWEIDWNSGST
jgi:hypothetical protein